MEGATKDQDFHVKTFIWLLGSRHNNTIADVETIALEKATKEEGPSESSNQSQLLDGDAARNNN
ncbi:unnamed protein product [Lupinus luteus]|uniref:Uncharacterized protein n=1 Tax=Lupinus luteus TaxID=3873 RepID=A0AAV1W2M5_LUPLU